MRNNNINNVTNRVTLGLILALSLLGANMETSAQSNNEVSFYLQGSFSNLKYEAIGQESDLKNGFGLGTKYAYYFNDNWSLGTGAEIQYMEGSIFSPSLQGSYITQDSEAETFEFRYSAGKFSERQEVYFLNIPLQIQYESSGTARFYASAGVKAGLVLNSEYQSSASFLETSGYYAQYDVELTSPTFAGFGEFGAINNDKSEFELKTNFVAHLESGVKLMLESNRSLYLGLFLDYGLNDIKAGPVKERLLEYRAQNPTEFTFESLLLARKDSNSSSYSDEIKTLAYGLKIQYAFQF